MRSREILFGLFLSLSMTVSAQTDTLSIPSTEEVYRQNYWLTGTNPVGLSFNRFRSFSVAEASYSHHKGNFGNVSIPASADIYSVYSESFQTVDKVSIYGKIGYTQFQNRQQNWNGMTGDYWQAVNLCDSISGKQRSEEYQLAGGFSLPVHPRWLLGAKADYRVQLTAKDTDPRNKNQWMEWRLTPGVGYLYGNLHLGASLLYVRRKETVNYQNMGSHTTYPVLVAYPLGFFKTLSWGENVNWYYSGQEVGGALQLHFNRGSFQLYQDISGSAAWQTVESDRIKNKKEGETDSWQVEYKGKLQKVCPDHKHEWEWLATFNHADNFDPLQHQVEYNTWQSDGRLLRSTRRTSRYALTYGYYQLRDAWHSRFSILSGITYRQAKTALLFYPAEYTQPIHRLQSILRLFKIFYCRMHPSIYLWVVSMEKVEERSWMRNSYLLVKMLRKLRYGRITADYNRCSIMKQCHVGGYILLLHIHDQHLFVGSFSWLLILKRRLIIRFIPIQKK